MNKKGFTLVEVTISVALLSLVMVFMLRFISDIRRNEDSISMTTDLLLNKTIIARSLNEDIKKSEGISSSICTSSKCTLVLGNDKTKTIEISGEGRIVTYKNETDGKVDLTRRLPEGYTYSLSKIENDLVTVIKISVSSNPEYNIEIVDDKVNH